jgi:hypothetical protein
MAPETRESFVPQLVELARQVGRAAAGLEAVGSEVAELRAEVRALTGRVDARLQAQDAQIAVLRAKGERDRGASDERRRWLGYGRAAAKGWPVLASLATALGLHLWGARA